MLPLGRSRSGRFDPDAQTRETSSSRPDFILDFTLSAVAIVMLSGCATYVTPPKSVPDPRPAFLLDHGRHTSLVLSTPTGSMVRYAYGDWRFYADQDTSFRSGAAALFLRTPATLARRELPGPPEEEVLRRQLQVGVQEIHVLTVSGALANRLREELDALHALEPERHQYVAVYDLVFAPHPEPYTLWNNSNTRVAEWLRSLGAEVRGVALWPQWRIEPPGEEPGERE
jgi:hypothetical protein